MKNHESLALPPGKRRLLRRRKWIVAAVMGVTFLFLLIYNLASYFYLKRIGRQLEEALDQRLEAVALLTAELIERSVSSLMDPGDADLLRLSLNRIRLGNELEAAYLISRDGRILLDSRSELEGTAGRSYLAEDSLAIRTAFLGGVQVSRLHSVAGNRFKSSYAPVSDIYGYPAVVALEANAGFLRVMDEFYQALYLGIIVSALLLAALAFFLVMAMLQFVRTESRLYQSERLASLGQMAATVAHEIRNPLAIIKSTADVLREKQEHPERTGEFFTYINEEIIRLNKIVDDFLAFSREPRLERRRTDLVPLLAGVAAGFSRQGVRVECSCEKDQFFCFCDPEKIGQVILNLLINARQAMREEDAGPIGLRLREERSRMRALVVIEVLDRGVGLQGRGAEIFEPFFTTKSSGTGLGLAVSKRIVEAHGGEISTEQPPQGGTMIRIVLPKTEGP